MKSFDTVFRGYDKEQVKKCLNEFISNYESLLKKSKETENENQNLRDNLARYKELETTLNRAIFTAESTCDKIKKMARSEAETVVTDARRNANRIVNDALIRADQINRNAEITKRNVTIYKRRLRSIIESQLDVIDEIDHINLGMYEDNTN